MADTDTGEGGARKATYNYFVQVGKIFLVFSVVFRWVFLEGLVISNLMFLVPFFGSKRMFLWRLRFVFNLIFLTVLDVFIFLLIEKKAPVGRTSHDG